MHLTRLVTIAGLVLAIGLPIAARAANSSAAVENEIPSTTITSQRAADTFLSYWVNRDYQHGLSILSRRLRDQINDKPFLLEHFSGTSNLSHAAFSLGRGKRLSNDAVCFEVELFEITMGAQWGSGIQSTFRVIREGNDWKVDTLPYNGETEHREAFGGCVAK